MYWERTSVPVSHTTITPANRDARLERDSSHTVRYDSGPTSRPITAHIWWGGGGRESKKEEQGQDKCPALLYRSVLHCGLPPKSCIGFQDDCP